MYGGALLKIDLVGGGLCRIDQKGNLENFGQGRIRTDIPVTV